MEEDVAAPTLDASRPNIARVYDYLLGGMDNFAADRAMADRLLKVYPQTVRIARDNRAFVTQAVTWAAQQGITQFLDLGSGLPTSPSVHEIARKVHPEARICYVDNDPMAVLHTRALMLKGTGPGVASADQDLGDPVAVLADPDVASVISTDDPVCVILASVLHFYAAAQAREIVGSYVRHMAPGSAVVISCLRVDDPALFEQGSWSYTAAGVYNHTREEMESFFVGLELVPPGLVPVHMWRGGTMTVPQSSAGVGNILGGVGLKLNSWPHRTGYVTVEWHGSERCGTARVLRARQGAGPAERRARAVGVHAVGDARDLDLPGASVDAVLLLGPLYHLIDHTERVRALRECARIVRPGGPVFAAAISRWASRIDGMLRERIYLEYPEALDRIDEIDRTGMLPPLHGGGFTAFCHRPEELRDEMGEAGLEVTDLASIEGPAFILGDLDTRMTDPADWSVVLEVARAIERVPELVGFGPHLLATGIRPLRRRAPAPLS